MVPATQEEEMRGQRSEASLGKKLVRPHYNNNLAVVTSTCNVRYVVGGRHR
jgi:hypothetical protein